MTDEMFNTSSFENFLSFDQRTVDADNGTFWNMEWDGTPDPRVELIHTGQLAFDGLTPPVLQTKYTSRSADLPLARYEEPC